MVKPNLILLIAFCICFTQCEGGEVQLHGAVTTVDVVLAPHKAAVEKTTGLQLTLVGNSAGKGLIDLAEGKCDAALTATDLASTVEAAKKAGKEVDAAKLSF